MSARFYLSGEIGEGKARAQVLGAFLRDNPGPVELFINSPGGIATEGAALMAEVERHGKVTARLQGVVASAATLPAVAASRIIMHPSAVFMIHEPMTVAYGQADALRVTAETLDKLTGIYGAAYAKATGLDLKLILAWMKAETWLSAEEAKELNFCDLIEETGAESSAVAAFDYTKFKSPPAELVRLAVANGWANGSPKMESVNA
jgi:ATP-dependent Clp protease protease subunit